MWGNADMSQAQLVWHELQAANSVVARRRLTGGLLGIVLLFMLCLAETEWLLLTGGPDAVNIVAFAEGIRLG
jgi:hypothetical protein